MGQILGLDLGTNSIGWALVNSAKGNPTGLIDKGVRIFQEGVKLESGKEFSKAAERTGYRSARRLKFRRKLRKIETLKVLSEYGYCPALSQEELKNWRYKKIYPCNDAFRQWYLTGNIESFNKKQDQKKNPYFFRYLAATEKLDSDFETNRFAIGRAFYHICQRRGFLSNRLKKIKESDGNVKTEIEKINENMGDLTLGQYFYQLFLKGEKIRGRYTDRIQHYQKEFDAICSIQGLPEDFSQALQKAIFYQRPLKSQKATIGKCVFEKKKTRCALSRPEFEEYRMLSFINSIKILTPDDEEMRFLNTTEKKAIYPLFYRTSKDQFDFEDIAKKLAPKNQYKFHKECDSRGGLYLFNYSMNTSVTGCPVSAQFINLLGKSFLNFSCQYKKDNGDISYIDIHDVWHAIASFDSEKHLFQFAQKRLKLDGEQAKKFSKISLKPGYASLSLNAIRKILPFLRQGKLYSHAVFLANMEKVVSSKIWKNEYKKAVIVAKIEEIISYHKLYSTAAEVVNEMASYIMTSKKRSKAEPKEELRQHLETAIKKKSYQQPTENEQKELLEWAAEKMDVCLANNSFAEVDPIIEKIKQFLKDEFKIEEKFLGKLYHPASLGVFPPFQKDSKGKIRLGSPRVASVRNPMAMRAIHQLRIVINELIKAGKVDQNTRVHIEMARELLDSNKRKALQAWQRERENKRKEYKDKLKAHFNREISEQEILKYQLWEEQETLCMYTGDTISLEELFGDNPKFDIEHTIPRSKSLDNSQENKTLCQNIFNRKIKKNRTPSELNKIAEYKNQYEEILERVKPWKDKYITLESRIEKIKKLSRSAATKEEKDKLIQQRHKLAYEKNYWKGKYHRFLMENISHGFTNSQLVDTGIITKYARLYLATYFKKVSTVKGEIVADFRKMWGIQTEGEKKKRINHVHHCIDAVTISCITKKNSEILTSFYKTKEDATQKGIKIKPKVSPPWPDFAESVREMENQILISHHTPDIFLKQPKKAIRLRGKRQKKQDGTYLYQKGDSARGCLHKESFYGAIERTEIQKNGTKKKVIKYVIRKSVTDLENKDIKNIVDDRVRYIVEKARKSEKDLKRQEKILKTQINNSEGDEKIIFEKQLDELIQKIAACYVMPNKNGNPVPIKKVRLFCPDVVHPLHIKPHRDESRKPHKRNYHAKVDEYFLMALYEGKKANGRTVRDFKLLNNFEAATISKRSSLENISKDAKNCHEATILKALYSGNMELPLKAILKKGQLVIFKKSDGENIYSLNKCDVVKRLYKIISFEKDGRVSFYFHQNAMLQSSKNAKEVTTKKYMRANSLRSNIVDFENPLPILRLTRASLLFDIEGIDFKLSPLGDIEPFRKE